MFNRKDKGKLFFREMPEQETRIEYVIGGKSPRGGALTVTLTMEEIIDALKEADTKKRLHRALDYIGDVDDYL